MASIDVAGATSKRHGLVKAQATASLPDILRRADVLTKEYVDQWLHLSKASSEYQGIVGRWLNGYLYASENTLVQRRRRPIFGFFRWLCMHNVARRIRKHRRAAVVAEFERKAVCVSNRLT
jgi:hypothetical protein